MTPRNYFRRLAEDYEKGPLAQLLLPFLEFASGIYGSQVRALRQKYENGKTKRKKLPFPVVSIGNLTWGGTGKTPLVEFIARRLAERGRKVLILTRGYGHDESEQMKHHMPDVLIGIGKNRFETACELIKKHPVDIAILDDGLQHVPLYRDLEIVMINALNPFGNSRLLPRGILREPLETLSRAHLIVLSHANLISPENLEKIKKEIHTHAPKAGIVDTQLEPLFFYRAKKKVRVPLNKLENQKVTTFSGVGVPRSFQLMLARLQIKPLRNFEFPDHHPFTEKDLKEIKDVSASSSANEIITTEKDFFRCQHLIAEKLNPLVLAARLRIASGEGVLMQKLAQLLGVHHP